MNTQNTLVVNDPVSRITTAKSSNLCLLDAHQLASVNGGDSAFIWGVSDPVPVVILPVVPPVPNA